MPCRLEIVDSVDVVLSFDMILLQVGFRTEAAVAADVELIAVVEDRFQFPLRFSEGHGESGDFLSLQIVDCD
jgi:hypothetical protein